MNIKKATIAAAVSAVLSVGAVGQASAGVYAGSKLEIKDLTLSIVDAGTFVASTSVSVNQFSFDSTNTAFLNGAGGANNAACGGTPGLAGAGNNCDPATRNASVYNAAGGTVNALEDAFTFLGTSGEQYSYADSNIIDAQLTGGIATETAQIAESQLQGGANASANANLTSTTGFDFTFTLGDSGDLYLNFEANPDLFASINQAPLISFLNGSAQASVSTTITLSQETDAAGGSKGFFMWSPDGVNGVTNNCIAANGLACVELADSESLNTNVQVSTDPSFLGYSDDRDAANPDLGFNSYGIKVTGLDAGTWTLSLNAVTSTTLRQQVPEPGMLALLGAGLLGLGMTRRRKKA